MLPRSQRGQRTTFRPQRAQSNTRPKLFTAAVDESRPAPRKIPHDAAHQDRAGHMARKVRRRPGHGRRRTVLTGPGAALPQASGGDRLCGSRKLCGRSRPGAGSAAGTVDPAGAIAAAASSARESGCRIRGREMPPGPAAAKARSVAPGPLPDPIADCAIAARPLAAEAGSCLGHGLSSLQARVFARFAVDTHRGSGRCSPRRPEVRPSLRLSSLRSPSAVPAGCPSSRRPRPLHIRGSTARLPPSLIRRIAARITAAASGVFAVPGTCRLPARRRPPPSALRPTRGSAPASRRSKARGCGAEGPFPPRRA